MWGLALISSHGDSSKRHFHVHACKSTNCRETAANQIKRFPKQSLRTRLLGVCGHVSPGCASRPFAMLWNAFGVSADEASGFPRIPRRRRFTTQPRVAQRTLGWWLWGAVGLIRVAQRPELMVGGCEQSRFTRVRFATLRCVVERLRRKGRYPARIPRDSPWIPRRRRCTTKPRVAQRTLDCWVRAIAFHQGALRCVGERLRRKDR